VTRALPALLLVTVVACGTERIRGDADSEETSTDTADDGLLDDTDDDCIPTNGSCIFSEECC